MIRINGKSLQLNQLVDVARSGVKIRLAPEAKKNILQSRRMVEEKIASGETIYGVTTGFGELCDVTIPKVKTRELQKNLIRSHATGVGDFLNAETVRGMMLLRINSLARGYSGVRPEVIDILIRLLNADILPQVPSQGSLGASGDLAPLAHIALALIGEGTVSFQGKTMAASKALARASIKPLELEAKEGLALINGTQMMAALGALCVHDAKNLARHADLAAAFSTDMLKGSMTHTHPLIHALRPFPGQRDSAADIRKLMEGSEIWASHQDCKKVQDAYSLRCAPQVHGASRDALDYAEKVIQIELNAVTDNPLVFPEKRLILNGGNFHGQPLALAMDFLGIAVAELGSISERRIARLVDHKLSEWLPSFLVQEGGLQSGFMVAQFTAASLVSENKVLAHPSSVDSIPTSGNQEDHVSMGATAARHARTILDNTSKVLAIEILSAAQALDFHRPLKTSKALEAGYREIRKEVPPLTKDRVLHSDIEKMVRLMRDGKIIKAAEAAGRLP